ncbi:unnamed protein product [Rotaria magnacalcarata]|uniref:Uncharacterized protein n=2 Tax=Rotaria magnacalcarata TaxID=392030 RepID=A0A814L677_9BILA|nr:unnamed protein product [Rotaria magnacalcarata]CAF1338684.1 unnamed protein product [Rotaria magnacalcarata]CAF2049598.1 unnamed protein product [Rotaria magnacalcarata]CAF2151942.1 unnamed protein product [Rotaria magnacalcarata]CAF4042224.1 unnamed protein product [Rotaria magnacalcarata]
MKKTFDSNLNKKEKHLSQKLNISSFGNTTEFDFRRNTKHLSKILKNSTINRRLDLEVILEFLSSHNCEQRLIIIHGLEYEYGYKLIDLVLLQPESPIRLCTLALLVESIELYVRDFHDLLLVERTDSNSYDITRKLLEILLGLNNNDTQKFKEIYANLLKTSVENDIEEAHGAKSIISRLFIALLDGKRYEVPAHSMATAKIIARQLHEVREGTSDIDYDSLIQIFTHDGFPQLSSIFDIYEDKYGRSINEAIGYEFKDQVATYCFRDMVEYIRLPSGYYSKILRQALDDVPIDYRTLIRIIIGHQNKDFCEIKLEYSKIYDETLEQTIEDRIDVVEIKQAFITIMEKAKNSMPNESRKIRQDRKNKIDSSSLGTIPMAIGDMKSSKHRSHEAFEKLAHLFKLKRPH